MKKGKFVLGTIIGAVAGVLLTPVKGKEARRTLKNKFNELKIKIQDVDFKEVREDFEVKVDEIQKELEDLDKEKVLKLAKAKSKIIKNKSDELVEYAVKHGKPVLEEMAKDVKKQTTEVLKDVVKKLETSEDKQK